MSDFFTQYSHCDDYIYFQSIIAPYLGKTLKGNREFFLRYPWTIKSADLEIKQDQVFLLSLIKEQPCVLRYIKEEEFLNPETLTNAERWVSIHLGIH